MERESINVTKAPLSFNPQLAGILGDVILC